jgi:hypothetical protein
VAKYFASFVRTPGSGASSKYQQGTARRCLPGKESMTECDCGGGCPVCESPATEVRECDHCGETRPMSSDPEEWTCVECFKGKCDAAFNSAEESRMEARAFYCD